MEEPGTYVMGLSPGGAADLHFSLNALCKLAAWIYGLYGLYRLIVVAGAFDILYGGSEVLRGTVETVTIGIVRNVTFYLRGYPPPPFTPSGLNGHPDPRPEMPISYSFY